MISSKVASNAPIKTGRLQNALRKANTLDTMFSSTGGFSKMVPVKQLTFSIDYAPDDAQYGMYWNDPTISHQVRNAKTANKDKINYVDKALLDPQVQRAMNQLVDLIGDLFVDSVSDEIDKQLK